MLLAKVPMIIAQITRMLGIISIWLPGLLFLFAGVNVNEPYLISLRGLPTAILLLVNAAVFIMLIKRGYWNGRGIAGKLLVVLWCLPSLSVLCADIAFEARKRDVLQTDAARARILGQHFVVGYSSFDEVAALAEKGLIGGVYVARHNIAGRTEGALKSEIAALQERRRIAGLPPLTALPPLSTLSDLPPDVRVKRAEDFGRMHGRELAALGVNHDFAPVLDLRPKASRNRFDFNTLINQRAISGDPAVVTDIGLAYVHGLEAFNVGATVKHFPGLGRVRADTHHFSADLGTPLSEFEASDWRPFRDVLAGSNAQLMIGHVTLTAVDPDRPASHSKRVVSGIIRDKWNYQGVIITDDR